MLPRLRVARYAVRSCSPSAPSLRLLLRSVAFGFTRYRLLALLRRSALLWLANSEVPGACCRTPPAPRMWDSLPRLCISPRHTPTSSKYEKREAFPPPFRGYQTATLPTRLPPCRAWTSPTPSRLPSQADRRSAPTGCARLLPARQLHRAAWKEFPSGEGRRPG